MEKRIEDILEKELLNQGYDPWFSLSGDKTKKEKNKLILEEVIYSYIPYSEWEVSSYTEWDMMGRGEANYPKLIIHDLTGDKKYIIWFPDEYTIIT